MKYTFIPCLSMGTLSLLHYDKALWVSIVFHCYSAGWVKCHLLLTSFLGLNLDRRSYKHGWQSVTVTISCNTVSMWGQQVVKTTLASFQAIRTDECFNLFWQYLEARRSSADVSPPTLPWRRKVPQWFEVGASVPNIPLQAKIITGRFISKRLTFHVHH